MTFCIVSDIDGTLAETLNVPNSPGKREGWESAVIATPPKPIIPMRTLLQAAAAGGMYVVYATSRRQSALREATMAWLTDNAFPHGSLYMRDNDNLRLAGDVLKVRMLRQIRDAGWRPIVWFEDEPLTVEALRNNGVHAITC